MESLREFVKFRIKFGEAARARQAERFSAGLADGNFEQWVVEEMLMHFFNENKALGERVEKLESLLRE